MGRVLIYIIGAVLVSTAWTRDVFAVFLREQSPRSPCASFAEALHRRA